MNRDTILINIKESCKLPATQPHYAVPINIPNTITTGTNVKFGCSQQPKILHQYAATGSKVKTVSFNF